MIGIVILIGLIILGIFYSFSLRRKITDLKNQIEIYKKELDYTKDELRRNQKQIAIYETHELNNKTITINGKKITKNNYYKGKRALVGDYQKGMINHTVNVLNSFGIIVDCVSTGEAIVSKIKHGYSCDIIFTNNIYKDGYDGVKTLKELKKIKGFKIPVVIHTVSTQKRDYFIDCCGFDEYVLKPLNQDKIKPILDKFLK